MPDATTAAFTDGHGIPVELRDVEAELNKLWGPAAAQVGGPELENPHLTRIVLANLVVECLDGNLASLEPVLATVVERFPCRTILLRGSVDPARKVTAEISALCHLPSPGQPQVCSERIVLHAGPNAVDLLPGAVQVIARGRPAARSLVDQRPRKAPITLSRPGRRLLASDPRPRRPRRGSRCPSVGPRLCSWRLQPRQRLVRPGSLA